MNQKNGKILILCPESDKCLGHFDEIEHMSNVSVKYLGLRHSCFRHIRRLIFSLSFFGIKLKMPQWIYQNDLASLTEDFEQVVFRSNVLEFIAIDRIQRLRDSGVRSTLLLLDSIGASSYTIKNTRSYIKSSCWDEIITFDPVEAKTFGWSFIGFVFYSPQKVSLVEKIRDIYLVTGLKGEKTKTVNDCYSLFSTNQVKADFDILITSLEEKASLLEGINKFRKSLPYSEVVQKVIESNCILEIVQDGQHGPSLRYFEAVFYNRKLLTNNPMIISFPFYNPDTMKIFSSVGDIDIEWVKKKVKVDYNYKGEFSPVHLIEYLRDF